MPQTHKHMKRILTAAIAVVTCHSVTANDLSAENLKAYTEIRKKLDAKEITITQAQILWRKHKNKNGKTKIISKSGRS